MNTSLDEQKEQRVIADLCIGVCGLGTVATGLVERLSQGAEAFRRRSGLGLRLVRIASRTPKPELIPSGVDFSTNLMDLVEDPGVDLVVELIGGDAPARAVIERALALGKPVVTANKEVLAKHGDDLFGRAMDAGVALGFEASVGGGIPIIKALREGLAGDQVRRIVGIVNGTTNFILSRMDEAGTDFDQALAEAQGLGYAEAQPEFDVEGIDAAHKTAIMAAITWGVGFDVGMVQTQGMTNIALEDLAFAKRLGYAIKHLGVAENNNGRIEMSVYPALVPESNVLAEVRGVTNAVQVHSRALGRSFYIGPGAGALPTANAVLSDILDIAAGSASRSLPEADGRSLAIPSGESSTAYYLRVRVDDKSGVLAQLADILAQKGISIDALLQPDMSHRAEQPTDEASIVLVTHEAPESEMVQAVRRIESLPEVHGKASLLRVHDGD